MAAWLGVAMAAAIPVLGSLAKRHGSLGRTVELVPVKDVEVSAATHQKTDKGEPLHESAKFDGFEVKGIPGWAIFRVPDGKKFLAGGGGAGADWWAVHAPSKDVIVPGLTKEQAIYVCILLGMYIFPDFGSKPLGRGERLLYDYVTDVPSDDGTVDESDLEEVYKEYTSVPDAWKVRIRKPSDPYYGKAIRDGFKRGGRTNHLSRVYEVPSPVYTGHLAYAKGGLLWSEELKLTVPDPTQMQALYVSRTSASTLHWEAMLGGLARAMTDEGVSYSPTNAVLVGSGDDPRSAAAVGLAMSILLGDDFREESIRRAVLMDIFGVMSESDKMSLYREMFDEHGAPRRVKNPKYDTDMMASPYTLPSKVVVRLAKISAAADEVRSRRSASSIPQRRYTKASYDALRSNEQRRFPVGDAVSSQVTKSQSLESVEQRRRAGVASKMKMVFQTAFGPIYVENRHQTWKVIFDDGRDGPAASKGRPPTLREVYLALDGASLKQIQGSKYVPFKD